MNYILDGMSGFFMTCPNLRFGAQRALMSTPTQTTFATLSVLPGELPTALRAKRQLKYRKHSALARGAFSVYELHKSMACAALTKSDIENIINYLKI